MTAAEWQQVKEVFHRALEREPNLRAEFVADACEGRPELQKEIERLLLLHEQAGDFIETPAIESTMDLPEVEPEPSFIGQRVGAYKIVSEIGRGGMGAVYLAIRADDQYQKRVAIKLVKRGIDSAEILRRFRNERQILASLDHPNIAKLLDGGTTEDGLPYFVMDYIEGQPVDTYCDTNRLTIFERLRLFRTVCSAVQYAHQNLVVHRDIKPGNILITGDGTPKLLDFGIAKLTNPDLSSPGIEQTLTTFAPMTPAYASPEQVRGIAITTASDVYSLGIVLYELLTGHAPYRFKSRDPREIAQVICEQEPRKPSTAIKHTASLLSPDGETQIVLTPEVVSKTREGQAEKLQRKLSGDLDNIILMAIRKEPMRRYASVEQFSEDIRRHLEGLPVIASKATLGYRGSKFIKRHKIGVTAATLIVISLVAGIFATLWQARIARQQRAEAELRFNDVRRLANSFLFEFNDAIENLPGSTPARELVVKRALEYLDSLAQKSTNDASLQRELATAYQRVGDIQGNQYSAHRGDTAGALENYRKALAIRESLAIAQPRDVQTRRELAESCDRIADISELMGNLSGALDFYRRSLTIRELLLEEDPSNASVRRDLARSYDSIGDTLARSGDAQAALDTLRKSLALRESLSLIEPTNAEIRRDLAISYHKIAEAIAEAGSPTEALENMKKALVIFDELAAADRTNAKAQRELSVGHSRTGDLLWVSGDKSGALESYREALKIRERLYAADPTNAQASRDLAIGYGNVGSTLAEVGDAAAASENLRKSLSLFLALSAKDQTNSVARHDVAVCYITIADAQTVLASHSSTPAKMREQHWREARSSYQRALDIFTELRNRGTLRAGDASQQESIAAGIKKCDEALKKLR